MSSGPVAFTSKQFQTVIHDAFHERCRNMKRSINWFLLKIREISFFKLLKPAETWLGDLLSEWGSFTTLLHPTTSKLSALAALSPQEKPPSQGSELTKVLGSEASGFWPFLFFFHFFFGCSRPPCPLWAWLLWGDFRDSPGPSRKRCCQRSKEQQRASHKDESPIRLLFKAMVCRFGSGMAERSQANCTDLGRWRFAPPSSTHGAIRPIAISLFCSKLHCQPTARNCPKWDNSRWSPNGILRSRYSLINPLWIWLGAKPISAAALAMICLPVSWMSSMVFRLKQVGRMSHLRLRFSHHWHSWRARWDGSQSLFQICYPRLKLHDHLGISTNTIGLLLPGLSGDVLLQWIPHLLHLWSTRPMQPKQNGQPVWPPFRPHWCESTPLQQHLEGLKVLWKLLKLLLENRLGWHLLFQNDDLEHLLRPSWSPDTRHPSEGRSRT